MPMSDFLEAKILNGVLNGVAYTFPTSVYIGLYTADPTDAGGGTEVSGVAYARVQMTAGWTVAGTATRATNAANITFPAAGAGGWGTAVAIGVFDLLAGGEMLYWEGLGADRAIPAGDIPVFLAGNVGITQD